MHNVIKLHIDAIREHKREAEKLMNGGMISLALVEYGDQHFFANVRRARTFLNALNKVFADMEDAINIVEVLEARAKAGGA